MFITHLLFEVDPLGLRVFETVHMQTYAPEASALASLIGENPGISVEAISSAVSDIIEHGIGFRPPAELAECVGLRLVRETEPEEEPI